MNDHNTSDMIERCVSSDNLPRGNFAIIDSEIVETQLYVQVMREICTISRRTKWVEDYNQYPTRRFEYPFAYLTVPLLVGMRVLDAGCSIDPFAPFLSGRGLITHGVDNFASHDVLWDPQLGIFGGRYTGWKKMQIYAEHLKNELKISVNYHNSDMASTNFSDQYFDRIFCISVLEHIPKYKVKIVFDEWRRILCQDGLLVLTIDYIVEGNPTFNIGKMLTETGFALQGKISLFPTSASSVVVAGFIAIPNPDHYITRYSRLYRKNALVRIIIDKVSSIASHTIRFLRERGK